MVFICFYGFRSFFRVSRRCFLFSFCLTQNLRHPQRGWHGHPIVRNFLGVHCGTGFWPTRIFQYPRPKTVYRPPSNSPRSLQPLFSSLVGRRRWVHVPSSDEAKIFLWWWHIVICSRCGAFFLLQIGFAKWCHGAFMLVFDFEQQNLKCFRLSWSLRCVEERCSTIPLGSKRTVPVWTHHKSIS